jgi:subtilisin family serine protease
MDHNGHGTATASQAAGRAGVARDASLIGIKVFPGSSETTTWSRVICGLNYVRKYNTLHPLEADDIDVVNISIAGPGTGALRSAVEKVIASGVVVVASAGNTGRHLQAPAKYAGVIAASGLTHGGTRYAGFSSRPGDVAAPAAHIFGADLHNGTSYRSGTSRAAPQVTGGVAVVLAINPAADASTILIESGMCPNGTERGTTPCPTAWPNGRGAREPRLDTYCAGVFATPGIQDLATCPKET